MIFLSKGFKYILIGTNYAKHSSPSLVHLCICIPTEVATQHHGTNTYVFYSSRIRWISKFNRYSHPVNACPFLVDHPSFGIICHLPHEPIDETERLPRTSAQWSNWGTRPNFHPTWRWRGRWWKIPVPPTDMPGRNWKMLIGGARWCKVVKKKHMYKITLILKDLQHPKMWDMSFPLFFLVKLCLAKCPKSKITVPNV